MELTKVHTSELNRHPLSKLLYLYVAKLIRNPDKGSQFDNKTKIFRWLWMPLVIHILARWKYEGILFVDEHDVVVGHVFYQKHGDSFKVFHWFIKEGERGAGLMTMMTNILFEHARSNTNIKRIWIGAGGNELIARFWQKIESGDLSPECGLRAGEQMGLLIFPERVAT